jgi:hypothetical protein
MKKLVLIAAMLMVVAVLAGCESSSSSNIGGPVGTAAADGTLEIKISEVTFVLPKGYTATEIAGGAETTGPANETVFVYAASTSEGERRMYEDSAHEWLEMLAKRYGEGLKEIGKKTFGDVAFQDIGGVEYAVLRGSADKDGAVSHIAVVCAHRNDKRVAVIAITPIESDLALDVVKAIK